MLAFELTTISGLRLLLYANVDEYLTTTESTGFQITAHSAAAPAFPEVQGISVAVGTQASPVIDRVGRTANNMDQDYILKTVKLPP